MYNFDNPITKEHGIPYSRYIASWIKVGGKVKSRKDQQIFGDWLESIGLKEEDINNMIDMAVSGKMELEENAKRFLKGLNTK